MHVPRALTAQLDALSAHFDGDGTDLGAILAVLADDLALAVPSFTGLTVTVQLDGSPVTIPALAPHARTTSRASLLLAPAGDASGAQVVFYAASPGAFVELGANARVLWGLDGEVVLDGHLPPPAFLDALAESVEINQAIGVLIAGGLTPAEAAAALDERAADMGQTRRQTAQHILHRAGADPEE